MANPPIANSLVVYSVSIKPLEKLIAPTPVCSGIRIGEVHRDDYNTHGDLDSSETVAEIVVVAVPVATIVPLPQGSVVNKVVGFSTVPNQNVIIIVGVAVAIKGTTSDATSIGAVILLVADCMREH